MGLPIVPSWAEQLLPCRSLIAFAYSHAMGRAHAPRPCAGPSEPPPGPPVDGPPGPAPRTDGPAAPAHGAGPMKG